MTKNRSTTGVALAPAEGRSNRRHRVGWALLGLLVVGLGQTGCKSDGCSSCGSGFGSKLSNSVQSLNARLFNHGDKGCNTCGTLGTEEGVIVDQGIPIGVPSAGATVIPGQPAVVPAPATGAEVSPDLAPIPSSALGPHGPITSSRAPIAAGSGASRSGYEAVASRNGKSSSRVGSGLSRAYQAPSVGQTVAVADDPSLFVQVPPMDLPVEVSQKADPVDVVEPASLPPAPAPRSPAPSPSAAPTTPTTPVTAAENRSAAVVPPLVTVAVRATPGIVRSASVAPTVVGGSLPSADGLTWLKEKGYRTLVDLRSRGEVDAAFPDQVSDAGMLYVNLPFPAGKTNATRLSRFNELLAQSDSKPLYFCDLDGRYAGLLWYLRLRSVDHEDISSARTKAEELGFNAAADQVSAEAFLKQSYALQDSGRHDGAIAATSAVVSSTPATLAMNLAPAPAAIVATPNVAGQVIPVPASPVFVPAAAVATAGDPIPGREHAGLRPSPFDRAEAPASGLIGRSVSWKPVTALVLSGMGVPLAYWSRTALFPKRGPRRASLTAKGPGPRKALS